MGNYQTISLSCTQGVARITLNRPGAMNALSLELLQELLNAFEEIKARDDLRVVALEGAGRAFSVGFDLQDFAGMMAGGSLPPEADLRRAAELGEEVIWALQSLEVVTVASVHGYAIGGGFLLMAACDFRVVEEGARFSIPEVDMGIPLLWGGVPLLARELSPGLARDLVMSCRKFGVEVLQGTGFISRLVAPAEREGVAVELARTLSEKPALALRTSKQQFLQAAGVQLPGVASTESDRFVAAVSAPDFLSNVMKYISRVRSG